MDVSIYFGRIVDSYSNNDSLEIGDEIITSDGEKYKAIKYLGKGTYGKVYQCIDKDNNFVALKETKNTKMTRTFLREFKILTSIQDHVCNPYIVCPKKFFKNSKADKFYIVTNYIDGIQLDLLKCSDECFLKIVIDILKSLDYINKIGIIHGDIKPENILCVKRQDEYFPVLIDFGLSCWIEKNLNGCYKQSGSLLYMAPETINDHVFYKNTDIWSLGISIYESINGITYKGSEVLGREEFTEQLVNICSDNSSLKIPLFKTSSKLLNDICNDMLICEHKKRPSAGQLLKKYKLNTLYI